MLESIIHKILEATENVAINLLKHIGKGNEKAADQEAVKTMRHILNKAPIAGTVVIGEGERDMAPMLYIGEELGDKTTKATKQEIDIAVDPLEGTTLCAKGHSGAMSAIAIAPRKTILNAPDVYMQKLITKDNIKNLNINDSIEETMQKIADHKKCSPRELKIIILERARHKKLIQKIRALKATIILINDGDISAGIAVAINKADAYISTGGAPEGVLAAAALKCLGGHIQGKLILDTPEKQARALKLGITDANKIYNASDMIKQHSVLILTAITDSLGMNGIKIQNNIATIESKIFNSQANYFSKIIKNIIL